MYSRNAYIPDGNDFNESQRDSIQLCDEDRGHGFVKSCAVHIHGGTDRHDKACYSRIDLVIFFETTKSYRQGCRAINSYMNYIIAITLRNSLVMPES